MPTMTRSVNPGVRRGATAQASGPLITTATSSAPPVGIPSMTYLVAVLTSRSLTKQMFFADPKTSTHNNLSFFQENLHGNEIFDWGMRPLRPLNSTML